MLKQNKRTLLIYICTILAVVVCLPPAFLHSAAPAKTSAHYDVSSKGFAIGDVTTTQRVSEEGGVINIHFETKTAVKASFLWMGYYLDITEKGILQSGDLTSYSRKGRENEDTIDVEGRLEHSSFRFDVREHGITRSIVIPRNSYDYTTMECPEARLNFADGTPISLRVLDVEKMAVVKRN